MLKSLANDPYKYRTLRNLHRYDSKLLIEPNPITQLPSSALEKNTILIFKPVVIKYEADTMSCQSIRKICKDFLTYGVDLQILVKEKIQDVCLRGTYPTGLAE